MRSSGSTLTTLNDDVNQLERFLDVGAPAILQAVLNVVLVGAVFAVASWQLLVLAFLPIPLIVAGSLLLQRRLEPLYDRVRDAVADLSGAPSANLAGVSTIKALTAEDRERERIAAAVRSGWGFGHSGSRWASYAAATLRLRASQSTTARW